jgi:hypothetical protein
MISRSIADFPAHSREIMRPAIIPATGLDKQAKLAVRFPDLNVAKMVVSTAGASSTAINSHPFILGCLAWVDGVSGKTFPQDGQRGGESVSDTIC